MGKNKTSERAWQEGEKGTWEGRVAKGKDSKRSILHLSKLPCVGGCSCRSSESVLSDQQDEEEEEVSRSGDEEGAKKGNGGKRKADSNGSSKEARKASVRIVDTEVLCCGFCKNMVLFPGNLHVLLEVRVQIFGTAHTTQGLAIYG